MTVISIIFGILAVAFFAVVAWVLSLRAQQIDTEVDNIRAMHPHALAGFDELDLAGRILHDRLAWQRLGGSQGLKRLAFNARCLVRIVQVLSLHHQVAFPQLRYAIGKATTIIALTILCYPLENLLRRCGAWWVPYISGHFAAVTYAQLETRVQTLLEGTNDDVLDQLRAVL